MKKLLTLALLAMPFFFASCDDDNDLPDVSFDVAMDGGRSVDGTLYVVRDTTLAVTSITVQNTQSDKKALITGAYFYWNYMYIGASIVPPFGFNIEVPADATPSGNLLEIRCPLYAEDKAPATAILTYKVVIVDSESDIPDSAKPEAAITPVYKKG